MVPTRAEVRTLDSPSAWGVGTPLSGETFGPLRLWTSPPSSKTRAQHDPPATQ